MRDPPGGARRVGCLPRRQAGRTGRGALRVRRDAGHGDRLRRAALAGAGQHLRLLPGLGRRPRGRHGRRVRPDDGGWHVISMWVSPQARGAGIAGQLIGAVARHARGQNAPTLTLWVTDGNDRARAFYRRAGFLSTGRRQQVRPETPGLWEEEMRLGCRRLRGRAARPVAGWPGGFADAARHRLAVLPRVLRRAGDDHRAGRHPGERGPRAAGHDLQAGPGPVTRPAGRLLGRGLAAGVPGRGHRLLQGAPGRGGRDHRADPARAHRRFR